MNSAAQIFNLDEANNFELPMFLGNGMKILLQPYEA